MAQSRKEKLGEIAYTANKTASLEIKLTEAIKTIFLRIWGKIDVTVAGTGVPAWGPWDLLKSISTKVGSKAAAFQGVSGAVLAMRNYKHRSRYPYLAVPAGAGVQADTVFEAMLMLDFAMPFYGGGDSTMWIPKKGNFNSIEILWGDESNIITGGTKAFDATYPPRVEVYAQVIEGIEANPGVARPMYRCSQREHALIVSAAQELPVQYGEMIDELHLHVKDGTGAYSDAVVSSIAFKNGAKKTFDEMAWAAFKRVVDEMNVNISPLASPPGVLFIDRSENNELSSLLNSADMKDLKLVANNAAAGTLIVLQNELVSAID